MIPEDIRNHVRGQPFRAFRVHLSNGSFYDIGHPEMIYVTRTEIVIAQRLGENEIPEESIYCDPAQITHLELIQRRTPEQSATEPAV